MGQRHKQGHLVKSSQDLVYTVEAIFRPIIVNVGHVVWFGCVTAWFTPGKKVTSRSPCQISENLHIHNLEITF